MRRLGLSAVALALAGCASSGVIATGPDTYMISKRSAQAGFGPPVAAKAFVYEAANKHCASNGLAVETVNYQGHDSGFGRPAAAELEFRCVPKP